VLDTPEEVAALPWVKAIRPAGAPYRAALSTDPTFVVWHVDVEFEQWEIPPDLKVRWQGKTENNNETWRKRPLIAGTDSGCRYSCGEVELAARLRRAGYQSSWVSEWSGYPHVDCWRPFCVKRSEIENDAPELWAFDHNLRTRAEKTGVDLGRRGGHPDVAAWKSRKDLVYIEYKGPGDSINEKQEAWARALLDQVRDRLPYLAVWGKFSA
jgi:hypothetical protein